MLLIISITGSSTLNQKKSRMNVGAAKNSPAGAWEHE